MDQPQSWKSRILIQRHLTAHPQRYGDAGPTNEMPILLAHVLRGCAARVLHAVRSWPNQQRPGGLSRLEIGACHPYTFKQPPSGVIPFTATQRATITPD